MRRKKKELTITVMNDFGPFGSVLLYCDIAPHMMKRAKVAALPRQASRISPPTLSK